MLNALTFNSTIHCGLSFSMPMFHRPGNVLDGVDLGRQRRAQQFDRIEADHGQDIRRRARECHNA
jgi:hypothetical protein